jgi:hypothetical protein
VCLAEELAGCQGLELGRMSEALDLAQPARQRVPTRENLGPLNSEIAGESMPFSGGRAVEGGTTFAFQLDKEGKPSHPFGAYKRLDNGGRIVVLGEGMASLFLGDPNAVRLSGDLTNPTLYWGKDSAIFMEEVLMWLSQ